MLVSRGNVRGPAAALALAAALTLGCDRPSAEPSASPAPASKPAGRTLRISTSHAWVTVHRPELAWPGYLLTFHHARVPVLLDMSGRLVHAWPRARVKSRVRLLPDGSILGIGLGRLVVEYDWAGRQTWELRTPGAIPHHDVLRLANGNTLVLVLPEGESADSLLEVDRAGRVVWTWKAAEHLRHLIPPRPSDPDDLTHINSLQELPENPWHAAGDRRFRPGNLLLSARSLDAVFVVDRASGEVVWTFADGLDRQHEALMNGPELPAPGRIQVFNNRLRSFSDDRQSEVLELDPRRGEVVWRYRSPGFFSPTAGVQQALPNGNVLVTSSRGGRIFEITRRGELAWEWVPPFEPVRAVRVPADACPQLAALAHRAGGTARAVLPPAGYRHVDRDVYRFARQGSRKKVVVDARQRTVLAKESDCRDLLLPAAATAQVGYGVDRERLRAAGRADRPPVFAVRLRPEGASEDVELLRDAVGLEGPAWRERRISLAPYGLQSVRLCVEIDAGEPTSVGGERFAFWEQPYVLTPRDLARLDAGGDEDGAAALPDDLTPEELEVQRKHLKALGYVG